MRLLARVSLWRHLCNMHYCVYKCIKGEAYANASFSASDDAIIQMLSFNCYHCMPERASILSAMCFYFMC